MGFGSDDKKIYDLLNDKMFIVAANQRKYVWTQNNWREMLEDIDLVFEATIASVLRCTPHQAPPIPCALPHPGTCRTLAPVAPSQSSHP